MTALFLVVFACSTPVATPLGTRSQDCATCHVEHYDDWSRSPHSRSADSPVFVAMLPHVEAAWGEFARMRCESCHSPGHGGDGAIGCVSCHQATGNHAERDGMLSVDPDAAISGPFEDAVPTYAHESRRYRFLSNESLCGTCHELTGPELLIEPTLTEFRESSGDETCIDCHMPREGERRLAGAAGPPRPVRSHRFVGFDPPYGASDDEQARAADETRALLAAALELRIEDGELVLENAGARHCVPTGATFLRDIWVDLEVGGEVVAPRVVELGDRPLRSGREVALVTEADEIGKRTLGRGEEARAAITLASGEAVLRARAVRSEIVEALGLTAIDGEIPTHEIARVPF
jgi:hypothetical protein